MAVLAVACDEPPTAADPDARPNGSPSASLAQSSTPIPLVQSAVSSTGVPLMELPTVLGFVPNAMNDAHVVVGTLGSDVAYVWYGGSSLTNITAATGQYGSKALHISSTGLIVGEARISATGVGLAYVWDGATRTILPTPPHSDGTGYYAHRIDDDGTVLVRYYRSSNGSIPGGNASAVIAPPYDANTYEQVPWTGTRSLEHVVATDMRAGFVVGKESDAPFTWSRGQTKTNLLAVSPPMRRTARWYSGGRPSAGSFTRPSSAARRSTSALWAGRSASPTP